MQQIPNISEAEWEIMKVLWEQAPISANDVAALLSETTNWKPNTVKTLISRLVKKQAVRYEQEGKTYFYYPAVSQETCIQAESQSFLQRIYGGALKQLLVHFLQEEKLSSQELDELRQILKEKGNRNE